MAYAAPNQVAHITLSEHQIKFVQTQPQLPHIFVLTRPDRLVFDFSNSTSRIDLKELKWAETHVPYLQHIRVGHPHAAILRIVFDLKTPVHFKHQFISGRQAVVPIEWENRPNPEHTHLFPNVPAFKKTEKIGHFIVVIDPGHGGKDPGAIGDHGAQEKNVVLAIAKALAVLLEREGVHAILTRNGDETISLYHRMRIARQNKADLFIAIHADSYFNRRAKGASVYALSRYGATSLAARWLAVRENHSELNQIVFNKLNDQSYLLRSVLIDLAQTASIRDSLRLGLYLLASLKSVTDLHYARVEQAPFMVLKFPDIPSLLIETGFISNAQEEKRLQNKTYQHQIALALLQGIQQYQKQLG